MLTVVNSSDKILFIYYNDKYYFTHWNKSNFYDNDKVILSAEGKDFIIIESQDHKRKEIWNLYD